jgi:gluconolactonase
MQDRRSTLAACASALAVALVPGLAARTSRAQAPAPTPAATSGEVVRLDAGLDALIAPDARVERAATGFKFAESPLWRKAGYLWFSDLIGNVVYQLTPDGTVSEVLSPGGYDGDALPEGSYLGPNGMAAGPDSTLTLCQHGNRRIVSIAPDRKITVLVDRFEGKRLNSPNDVAYAPDGSLYFTDPPYGLPGREKDPARELAFNGVYRFAKGKLQLLLQDIPTPNGIAFSPDYRTLYVTSAAQGSRKWMRYDVQKEGTLGNGLVFVDASASTEPGTTDGLKVDAQGNLYATGPGGIWVMSADGRHLGTIKTPETPSSLAFGGADGRTLYITARTSVFQVQVKVAGAKSVYN